MQALQLIHRDANRAALVSFQVYVFGLWLVRIAAEPLHRLAVPPRGYYDPVGVLRLLPDATHAWLLGTEGLVALRIALLTTCALSLWPRAFRYAAPVAALLLMVHQSLIRGFGHINHAEILSLLAAVTLAIFANLPQRKPSPAYNPNAVPLITVAVIVTLCYSLVGFARIQTGISVFTGDTIINYVVSRSLRSYYYDFNLGMAVVSWAPVVYLLKAGFPLVTVIEALAPLVLVSRWFRGMFLAVMVPFHLLTLVLMEVSFMENLLLYVVLVDFSRLFGRWVPSYASPPPASTAEIRGDRNLRERLRTLLTDRRLNKGCGHRGLEHAHSKDGPYADSETPSSAVRRRPPPIPRIRILHTVRRRHEHSSTH